MKTIKIGDRFIGPGYPTYIIAEIGSNFDGNFEQAKMLINLAKECGADAVKFQSFKAENIVCGQAFNQKTSFQKNWDKDVFAVYKDAEFPLEWHKPIMDYCKEINIDFFSTVCDFGIVDFLDSLGVPIFKINSGDITYLSLIEYIAKKGRPIILATGASDLGEIEEAVRTIRNTGNENIFLLQCITNYPSNFENANIKAMTTISKAFQTIVGYSDHTPGNVVPLGAVALGANVIEKHFTHDKTLNGPDHSYAMDVNEFKSMVEQIRLLEKALGTEVKELTPEETETVILQRRSLYAKIDIPKGTKISDEMLIELRPVKGLIPKFRTIITGRIAQKDIHKNEPISWECI